MKVVVIGGNGTIGSAVAKALGANGHQVLTASRGSELKVDLQDQASIEALFASVPNVNAVVSCAGDGLFKPLTDLTDADFELCLRSKLMGQVNLVRAAAKHLLDRGSVTVTTGTLAMHPMPGSAAISLVNAGLDGFVRGAGLEMPRGIRVNAVSPGWITETLLKFGMDPSPGLPAVECANVYVSAVEGADQGKIIEATKLDVTPR